MEVSPPAIIIIQEEETFKDKAYDDARPEYNLKPGDKILGTLTIGYGHTDAARDDDEKIQIGDTVTEEEAKETVTVRAKEQGEECYFEKVAEGRYIVYRKRDKKVMKSVNYFRPDLMKFFSDDEIIKTRPSQHIGI